MSCIQKVIARILNFSSILNMLIGTLKNKTLPFSKALLYLHLMRTYPPMTIISTET
jgi:hypothetical protein